MRRDSNDCRSEVCLERCDELDQDDRDLAALRARLTAAEAENAALSRTVNDLNDWHVAAESEAYKLHAENATLRQRLAAAEAENERLREALEYVLHTKDGDVKMVETVQAALAAPPGRREAARFLCVDAFGCNQEPVCADRCARIPQPAPAPRPKPFYVDHLLDAEPAPAPVPRDPWTDGILARDNPAPASPATTPTCASWCGTQDGPDTDECWRYDDTDWCSRACAERAGAHPDAFGAHYAHPRTP